MGINYAWLAFCMPGRVAGQMFLSGFIVASLVSATHQSEEIMEYGEGAEYVEGQFRSTRDAETVFGPLETWIWGGMDTQLEHHLFPTMPRYKYHELRPHPQGVGQAAATSTTAFPPRPRSSRITSRFSSASLPRPDRRSRDRASRRPPEPRGRERLWGKKAAFHKSIFFTRSGVLSLSGANGTLRRPSVGVGTVVSHSLSTQDYQLTF